jgi:hypothetical protein
MIHYHVWFDLKPHIAEGDGLATVERFLGRLTADDEVATFRLLRNKGGPPRSKVGRYHALIEFADDAQLTEAMRRQAARGIHSGLHGAVMDVVASFHVEIFETIQTDQVTPEFALQACEI